LLLTQEGADMLSVDVTTRRCDAQVAGALRGELDLAGTATVVAAAAAREYEIIIDLAGLEFIDCRAALVHARKQVRDAGTWMHSAGTAPASRRAWISGVARSAAV
jgi:anti-anti-sigma regulatory factor